ncbi:transglycosylase SLT domain-containing protein [Acidithiobacillus sp.]|uniref:transglycosylase SLT domain-containing protein n=2 Tax=Acidithiobacillus TaxID=119977 RepID=UPI00094B261B|nr:transglycosylase SLT domain-containing protein [Acidithiobacillus sp.]MDD5278726.1 transglycosylase SLT domain-containing protein [Acidithiobacillus sp.]
MLLQQCIHSAAARYSLSPQKIERRIHSKKSGIGIMGINPGWLVYFKDFHVSKGELANNACLNVRIGAWVMSEKDKAAKSATPATTALQKHPSSHNAVPTKLPGLNRIQRCAIEASRYYGVPALLTLSIIKTEGGQPGTVSPDANGSYDMGVMQINSIWLPKLASMGVTRHEVIHDGCQNVMIGTWILAGYVHRYLGKTGLQKAWEHPGRFWRSVGDYNSHTPTYNNAYQTRVANNYRLISENIVHKNISR